MSKTRVVHINDNVPGAVYIGRAAPWRGLKKSPWANPYRVGKPLYKGTRKLTRDEAVEWYDHAIRLGEYGTNNLTHLVDHLHELVGKPLACWCRHDGEARTDDTACHGDVLVALIEELGLEQEAKS